MGHSVQIMNIKLKVSVDIPMVCSATSCFNVASYSASPGFYRLQYEKLEGLEDFEMYVM